MFTKVTNAQINNSLEVGFKLRTWVFGTKISLKGSHGQSVAMQIAIIESEWIKRVSWRGR